METILPFEMRLEIALSLPLLPALRSVALSKWDTTPDNKQYAVLLLSKSLLDRDFLSIAKHASQSVPVTHALVGMFMEHLIELSPNLSGDFIDRIKTDPHFLSWYMESFRFFLEATKHIPLPRKYTNIPNRMALASALLRDFYVTPFVRALHSLEHPTITWYYHVMAELMGNAFALFCSRSLLKRKEIIWVTMQNEDGLDVTFSIDGSTLNDFRILVSIQSLPRTNRVKWKHHLTSFEGVPLDQVRDVAHALFQTILMQLDPWIELYLPLGITIPQKIRRPGDLPAIPNVGIMGLSHGMRIKLDHDSRLSTAQPITRTNRREELLKVAYLPATGYWWS